MPAPVGFTAESPFEFPEAFLARVQRHPESDGGISNGGKSFALHAGVGDTDLELSSTETRPRRPPSHACHPVEQSQEKVRPGLLFLA